MRRTKWVLAAVVAAVLGLVASACSSGGGGSDAGTATTVSSVVAESVTTVTAAVPPADTGTTATAGAAAEEPVAVVVSFTASNGQGSVTISGGSPVAVWFGNQHGEVSLDLIDADAEDAASVVEGLVSFWFFQDGESGDTPPSILVSAEGAISDSVGTRYVVESQGFACCSWD